jgi:hypothetical protein
MSDEFVESPGFWQDGADAEAPTERDPAMHDARRLAAGVALSVLWWVEDETEGR